jgi:putative addiction module CopG family antidote
MNVTLTTDLQQLIRRQIKAGRFENASAAVRESLRLLDQRDDLAGRLKSGFTFDASTAGGDIEAMVFIVLMEAAKSAREDLRGIMAEVKAINAAKSALRSVISKVSRDVVENVCQRNGKPTLKFTSRGIGSEAGYHRMSIPHADPESTGGVRWIRTDMHESRIKNVCDLCAIRDELRNKLDSMSEMGEMESLRLQIFVDRVSRMMTTLSNITKKIGDTQNSIVANLK